LEPALQTFLDSVDAESPSADGTPLLRAVWHGMRGEWDAAHEIAQEDASTDGAWVHAWLHRIEGDLSNAGYWYRRAHRPVAQDDTRTEGRAIASALLQGQ
jgi:hypothetical protein